MAEIKLDYVNSFYDTRRILRHQFRRKGHKKVTIKGRPGSEEFMEHYHGLLAQTGGPLSVAEVGASRVKAGTIDALIVKSEARILRQRAGKSVAEMASPHPRSFP
jgi:hypothetical protein